MAGEIKAKCPKGEKPHITKWSGTNYYSLCCTSWAHCKEECMVHNVMRFNSIQDAARVWNKKNMEG